MNVMGERRYVRAAGVACALVWLPALVASARRARVGGVAANEARVFHTVNDAPDWLEPPVWVVMQAGSLGAVVAAAASQARRGRRRSAVWTGAVGTAVWAGVKVVKPLVGRGRPEDELDDVTVRGARQTGLGYPSGHAAVAMTLACAQVCDRHPSAAGAAIVGAGVVGATRMYVGAHLPLDVVGGLAIGAIAGCGAIVLRGTAGSR